jgi:hypothetical protein
MNKEDKRELFVALCGYLPYETVIQLKYGKINSQVILKSDHLALGIFPKPYLRPLSSMTREETHETIAFPRRVELGIDINGWMNFSISNPAFIDWLNSHHFDYRRLIEKGLALEAPKGMYNYYKQTKDNILEQTKLNIQEESEPKPQEKSIEIELL